MPQPTEEEKDLAWRNYEDAFRALVDAVVGRKSPCYHHDEQVYALAWDLAEYFQAGQAVKKYNEEFDSKIAQLVGEAVGEGVPAGPYSESIYEAVLNLAKAIQAIQAWHAVACYRITDLAEYEAELARLRQIALTIDPATAETTVRWRDVRDPYDILDKSHHVGRQVREYFARNPGGDWVHFGDLPSATDDALWERDRHKRVESDLIDWRIFDMLADMQGPGGGG